MRRRLPEKSRRSTLEWVLRGSLALVVAGVAVGALRCDYAQVLSRSDPARASAAAPGNARITAAASLQMVGPDANEANRLRAEKLARAALARDATAIDAVATLGINAQLRGDTGRAHALFAYAERLSRRHLPTQLFRIQDAVQHGDVPAAIRHYDIALRTSRSATNLLFPIMSAAIGEPSVRDALVHALARGPNWGASFVQYVAANGPDAISTAALLRQMARSGVSVPVQAQSSMVTLLVARRKTAEAWNYYRFLRPGARRDALRDPSFAADLADPTPFDWNLVNETGLSATLVREPTGGMVDFTAPGGVGGTLIQQLQVLPPGHYRLQGHSRSIEQPATSQPYWSLSCGDGAEVGRVEVPSSAIAGGKFAGDLTVPTGCPVQILTLVARPSDAAAGMIGQIDRVEVTLQKQQGPEL